MSLDPLSVVCPHCAAEPGEPCLKPDGEDAPKPHARREKAAQAAADAQRRRAAAEVPDRIEGDRWRRLFSACRTELELKAQWTSLAREQLETMVLNMRQAAECRLQTSTSPTVDGSQGQQVPNKLWVVQGNLDGQALAIAKALKLTPDTRGTSATAGGAEEERPPADAGEAENRDELAELDELAVKRRDKAAGRGA